MDDRLIDVKPLSEKRFRKLGLEYYGTGENHDYLADELLLLTKAEAETLFQTANEVYDLLLDTVAACLAEERLLQQTGLPEKTFDHLRWSWEHERDDHLVARFDFAGGFDGLPAHVLEINADTCSLLPETTKLQHEVLKRAGYRGPANRLTAALTDRLRQIAKARGGDSLLGSYLGEEDDHLNLDVLTAAARAAGWSQVDTLELPSVTFDPEYGMLFDLGNDNLKRYNYLLKFFPWDWAATEEPELFDLLAEMSQGRLLRVLNPAWTALLQSKALLVLAHQRYLGHPALLPTAFDPADLPNPLAGYVRKPVFGRMGENIMVSLDGRRADAETRGDYGAGPVVYQQLAPFNTAEDGYRYQLSVFQAPRAVALCGRRQEGLVLGEDAEFVSVGLQ